MNRIEPAILFHHGGTEGTEKLYRHSRESGYQ